MAAAEHDAHTSTWRGRRVRVTCRTCGDQRVAASAVAAGVSLTRWRMPAELLEPRLGGPVTVDEVLDFHVALQGDDWFDELLRA